MLTREILDDVITCLEQAGIDGVRELYLPPGVSRALFEDVPVSPAEPDRGSPPGGPAPVAAGTGNSPPVSPSTRSGAATDRRVEEDREETGKQPGRVVPSAAAFTPDSWEDLHQAVTGCTRCPLHRMRNSSLFETGSRRAQLMFIGDFPPDAVVEQMMARMIKAMRFRPDEVYYSYILKCRPPGRRRPEDEEVAACIPYLQQQIVLVAPKMIVLLGEVALLSLLGYRSITRWRGRWLHYHDIPVMPIYNPLYMHDHPESKQQAWRDLQQVMRFFGRDPEKHADREDGKDSDGA